MCAALSTAWSAALSTAWSAALSTALSAALSAARSTRLTLVAPRRVGSASKAQPDRMWRRAEQCCCRLRRGRLLDRLRCGVDDCSGHFLSLLHGHLPSELGTLQAVKVAARRERGEGRAERGRAEECGGWWRRAAPIWIYCTCASCRPLRNHLGR